MSRRILIVAAMTVAVVGFATWAAVRFLTLPEEGATAVKPVAGQSQPAPTRRISATLFYVAADGLRLTPVQRVVLFGATPAEQARRLIEAQLEPAPAGLTNAVPAGVTLRDVFVAENGDAYVDFSTDLQSQHPGGSLNEIFTVYTLVHALTANLPAIHAVQILVGGHEVDTLAGHVDLRRPLPQANQWLDVPGSAAPQAAPPGR